PRPHLQRLAYPGVGRGREKLRIEGLGLEALGKLWLAAPERTRVVRESGVAVRRPANGHAGRSRSEAGLGPRSLVLGHCRRRTGGRRPTARVDSADVGVKRTQFPKRLTATGSFS